MRCRVVGRIVCCLPTSENHDSANCQIDQPAGTEKGVSEDLIAPAPLKPCAAGVQRTYNMFEKSMMTFRVAARLFGIGYAHFGQRRSGGELTRRAIFRCTDRNLVSTARLREMENGLKKSRCGMVD